MKRYILAISCLLSFSMLCRSNSTQKSIETWIDVAVKAKSAFNATLQKAGMPVASPWMKVKSKAEPLRANVKGCDKLVLITTGGPDGSSYDHAVWGNARLIAADGSSVWLDDLSFEFAETGWGDPKRNINIYDKPIRIGGKLYEHAVLCHAQGVLVYPLNGKYVRFEAEVGIDDASLSGSAYFRVMNVSSATVIEGLTARFPIPMGKLNTQIESLHSWLTTPDASVEKQAGEAMAERLKESSHYKNLLRQIGTEKNVDTQTHRYLSLLEDMQEVFEVQTELEWLNLSAIKQAFADMKQTPGYNTAKYEPLFDELTRLGRKGFADIYKNSKEALADARKALELKRTILLSNSLLDGDKIVATRYQLGVNARSDMAPRLGTQANNWSSQESAHRSGFEAEIVELSKLRDKIQYRSIYKPRNSSSITDLKMHWEGDRVMFTATMPDNRWNIHEIRLDGSGYRTLIDNKEPDLEFYDGTYLPDGRLLAISNIGYQGVPCVNGSDPVGNTVLYDPKTKNLRRLTFDQDANWNPVVMNNGRVMYTRWEYTDLMHYYSRFVMHMNPDGTEQKALYGSGSAFPNSTFDIQPLPGHSSAFVGIISGHHGVARSGRLILFDPTKARQGAAGMIQEIPHRNRPIVELIKDQLVNDVWPQFIKPTPLNDKYYLVTAKLNPQDLWGIYLVDVFDNITCLMKQEGAGFISPIAVRKTHTPPAIPDRVKLDEKEATVFIQDIYEGEGLRGVPRGTVKEIRLHAYEYAYLKTVSDHNWQGVQSGWDIKRRLGTVPVEEDGSVIFKVPANTPISIQPVDKDGAAIQWMRSWFTGQPGEVVSCVGCHEDQNQIPVPKRVIASKRLPHTIQAPEGGVRSFTFDLEVQPVLDRACISCHDGEKAFDLRGGKKDAQGYGTAYLNLHPYVHRQGAEADMAVLQPYEYHANTSELVRILKKGHANVKLTDPEWRILYNWIDYNAPDKGYFNASKTKDFPYQGYDQIKRRTELTNKYANGMGVDWKKEIEEYASYLKGKGPIAAQTPEKKKPVKEKEVRAKHWPFDADALKDKLVSDEKETRKEFTIAPGIKITLVRIPAGEFAMGSWKGAADNRPVSRVKINRSFWMGEVEITNEQYNVVFPEHDSRYVDQLWKDHVHFGYPANQPKQPVIRVSHDDAMAYCQELSKRIGCKVTLPTEAQWEWACRAGSNTDFWYGHPNTDFGRYENLADASCNKMAVTGIDPQPMSKSNPWYKYYTYLPKEETVDDGAMNQVDSKNYQANAFGLHSMHGNVAEWTRSEYAPYPYSEKTKALSGQKVVRGGSYIERPKFSTSYSRKAYYPYQRVFNVGFRIIIED